MAYTKGVSAIARVIQRLIKQNGLMNGVKKAQKLGFPDAKIKSVVSKLAREQKSALRKFGIPTKGWANPYRRPTRSTFGERKAERVAEQGGYSGFSSREEMMANNPFRSAHWGTDYYG